MTPLLFGQLVHVAPQNFVCRQNSEGGNGLAQNTIADWIIWYLSDMYCMDGSVELNVNHLHLQPQSTSDNCTAGQRHRCISSIYCSASHQLQQRSRSCKPPPTTPTFPRGMRHIIILNRTRSKYDYHPNPLLDIYLTDDPSRGHGWGLTRAKQ